MSFFMQMAILTLLTWTINSTRIIHNGRLVVSAMSISGKPESRAIKMTSVSSHSTRARFLSSSAATFLTASAGVIGFVAANSPDVCFATQYSKESFNDNPRYIEKELQMQYGESPGTLNFHRSFKLLSSGKTESLLLHVCLM